MAFTSMAKAASKDILRMVSNNTVRASSTGRVSNTTREYQVKKEIEDSWEPLVAQQPEVSQPTNLGAEP